MIKTRKRALALAMALCLALTLGVPALAADVTLTPSPASVTAGTQVQTVTLTTDSGNFSDSVANTMFSILDGDAIGVGSASVSEASKQPDNPQQVKLTLSNCTPTKQGTLTIQATAEAFQDPPASEITTDISVNAAPGDVTAGSTLTLTAGVDVETQTVMLTASENLKFKSSLDELITLEGQGKEGLNLKVTWQSETSVQLTLTGIPTAVGELKVNVPVTAFEYEPDAAKSVTIGQINPPHWGN